MRIIERNAWSYQFRCTGIGNGGKGCNSLLEAERDDLRHYAGKSAMGWGDRDPAVSARCPVCGAVTDLPREKWPVRVEALRPWSQHWADTGDDPGHILFRDGEPV